MVQLDQCLSLASEGKLLDVPSLVSLCNVLKEVLASESNIVAVDSPVIVCGDIHGQFHDLIELFALHGCPPDKKYIFLGDYVDRGSMSVECMTYLFALKAKYPYRITLVRGNHESRQTTQIYGFFAECQQKFQGDPRVWRTFTDVFDFLPIGTVVDQKHFSLHGGLSPRIHSIDQLRVLDRFMEIPTEGPFADIVWSDPDPKHDGFHVSPRGAGYIFGADVVARFVHLNALEHISRAHQLCMEGYQVLFDETMSTVWSAPNYCFRFGNLASVMKLDEKLHRNYSVFKEAPAASKEKPDYYGNQAPPSSSNSNVESGYFT